MADEFLLKLLVLGDGAVGKTSLVERFLGDKSFDGSYLPTLGANVKKRTYDLGPDAKLVLSLWDVGGQRSFNLLQPQFFNEAGGAILVFDQSRPETIRNLKRDWLPLLKKHVTSRIPTFIVGNKYDLKVEPEVERAVLKETDRSPFPVYRTSAKTGYNVNPLFEFMICNYLENID
ncbi:MAG: Rab family GTPase [Promethearchaeota archaeon]